MSAPYSDGELSKLEEIYHKCLDLCWRRLKRDPAAMLIDTRNCLFRQRDLYILLRSEGRKIPARLPLERRQGEMRKEMAL